jgi:hypothetical protein
LKKLSNEVALTHTGPVELAAVGVSIALFNQASRIAIFPLVAEEDAIGRVSPEGQDCEYLETGSNTDSEHKELIPKKGVLSIFYCFILNVIHWFSLFVHWILLLVS